MTRARRVVLAGLVWLVAAAGPAGAARVQVTSSKPDVLYSAGTEADCGELSAMSDEQLPFNVVRLRAVPPGGADPSTVRFQWQLPKPAKGVLLADQDLGPDGQASIVRTLCSEVGNGCTLTDEQLAVYNRPTILWVAPTCGDIPDNTTKPYRGGSVRIGVKVFNGRRKLGKGSTVVGFGRIASATLLVSRDPDSSNASDRRFRNGHGVPNGEGIPLFPTFGAQIDIPANLPAITGFQFDTGGGSVERPAGCPYPGLASCTIPGQIVYTAAVKDVALLAVELADGSLVCDKLTVKVLAVPLSFTIDVTTTPGRKTFTGGEGVNLRVRLRNTSPPSDAPNILFTGNVLSCNTQVRIGSSTLTKAAQIDLQHCSTTIRQPCNEDADCQAGSCPDCVSGETCVTASHCASAAQGCVTDRDCQGANCPFCEPNDICVQVLPISSINLGRGDAVDVVDSNVVIDNKLPSRANVKDEWTAHSFNAGDESKTLTYSIRPTP